MNEADTLSEFDNQNNYWKKADLISSGEIYVPPSIRIPCYPSKSTAGPGAGIPELVFSFGGSRVKLSLTKDQNTIFSLAKTVTEINETNEINDTNKIPKGYSILKNGSMFIGHVKVVPTLLHAPSQAFINIDSRCIYNCKFCSSPILERHFLKCSRL